MRPGNQLPELIYISFSTPFHHPSPLCLLCLSLREECNRYHEERNIFRAKYLDLKKKHATLESGMMVPRGREKHR